MAIHYGSAAGLGTADLQQWGYCHQYRVIEYTGDGRADLLCVDNWEAPAEIRVKESTTAGWMDRGVLAEVDWDEGTNGPALLTGDFNGDGRTDLMYASGGVWVTALNTGGAFGPAAGVGANAAASSGSLTRAAWLNMDDDKADELLVPAWTLELYEWNPTSGALDRYLTQSGASYDLYDSQTGRPNLPDINGDGLPDLAYKTFGQYYIVTRLNTGNGFGPEQISNVPAEHLNFWGVFVDATNDGRDDLLLPTGSGFSWQIHPSTGATFAAGSGGGWIYSGGRQVPADVTGDGRKELVVKRQPAPFADLVLDVRSHLGELEAITTFWDGLGNWQKPTYATISTMEDYILGTAQPTLYPRRFFGGPLYVVDHYEANTGTHITGYSYATGVQGASYTMDYSYQGARSHNEGRGFLGLNTYVVIDSRTGVYGAWKFRQDFPYVGRLDNSWVFQPTMPAMVTTDPVWNHTPATEIGGTRYFVFEDSNTAREYEVGGPSNGQLIRTVLRDPTFETTYGSVDLETITTTAYSGESYTTTIDYTLQHLTGPWCLGLADAISVTRSGYQTTSETRTVDNVFNGSTCRLDSSTNTSEGSSQSKQLKTSFTYDAYGNPKKTTLDSANLGAPDRVAEFFYDIAGHAGHLPSSVKRYISGEYDHTESMTWDYRFATPLSHTSPNGQTVSWQYDDFGRMKREDRPDGTNTTWIRGLCTTCVNSHGGLYFDYDVPSNGMPVVTYFDTYGRKVATQSNTSVVSEILWRDALGRVEEQFLPYESGDGTYSVFYGYDLANRITQENRPFDESQTTGRITTWQHDRLKTTVSAPGNPTNQTTQLFTDALGRTTRVIDARNGTSQYAYYAFDQLKSAQDPDGHTTTIVYNNRGDKMSMTDPDMGFWQYDYNVFGELIWQKDAKGQVVAHEFDQLGRPDWRSEPEFPGANPDPNYWQDDGRTDWAYYNATDHRHGLLASEIAPDGFRRDYQYDSLGRASEEKIVIDGVNYFTNFAYATAGTAKGALERITYPTSTSGVRFKVDYEYSTGGLLSKVKDGDNPSTVFYHLTNYDGLFRETQATLGNGVIETRVFDRANLLLESIQAGSGASIQNLAYEWWPAGTLRRRTDYIPGKTEDFTYDALNRLETQSINGTPFLSTTYKPDGNIWTLTAVGTYAYGGSSGGPHAVTSVSGVQSNTYAYDANGNMTNRDGDAITWYSHNLPKKVNYGSSSAEFWYGTDRARYKQVAIAGGTSSTTRYIGGHYEVETRGGLTIHRHNILAGGQAVAQYERRSDASNTLVYLHRDHQGSVVASSGSSGLRQRWEYEPFGTRWRTAGSSPDDTERGYTDHEHLDSVALTHMNGRVQDPMLGRFISADPFVSEPYFGQSLNRYSYVWNNPTALTDPSGFDPDAPVGPPPAPGPRASDPACPFTFGCHVASADAIDALHSYGVIQPAGYHRALPGLGSSPQGGTQSAAVGGFWQGFNSGVYQQGYGYSSEYWGALSRANVDNTVLLAELALTAATAYEYQAAKVALAGALKVVTERFAARGAGGRLGSQTTRQHVSDVATEMESRGWTITHGGGRFPEEYLPGPGGGRLGSSYPDITATKNGRALRVNTIDTRVDGITPTTREAANAARIRSQTPGDHLLLVPKP